MQDLTNEEKLKFSSIMYNSNGSQDEQISKLTPEEVSKFREYYGQKIAYETVNAHLMNSDNQNQNRHYQNQKIQTICCCFYPENHKDKFDIRTKKFLKRTFATFLFFKGGFLQIGQGKPELYGPIWLTIAYAILLGIVANLSEYFQSNPKVYHFNSSYIGRAFGIVALFKIAQPLIYTAIVKCLKGDIKNIESAMLTGYSVMLYMVPTLFCFIPSTHWHLIVLGLAGIFRAIFLFRNYSSKIPTKSFPILIAALIIQALYCMVVIRIMFPKSQLEISKGTYQPKKL